MPDLNEVPPGVHDAIRRLASGERDAHGADFALLEQETAKPVPWSDAAWPEFVRLLKHHDNRVRSIAGQILSRLAPGASRDLVLVDVPALIAVTRDERFVTARHVLGSLWRVGKMDDQIRLALVDQLVNRSLNTAGEKNGALIRYDIVCCLHRLFAETGDVQVRIAADEIIAREPEEKNARKMRTAWKGSG